MKKYEVRFCHFIDTEQALLQKNPVLLEGELVIEKDTHRLKVGDGQSPYSQLEYMSTLPEAITAIRHEERLRVAAEEEREADESERIEAEIERVEAEIDRNNSEAGRVANELVREIKINDWESMVEDLVTGSIPNATSSSEGAVKVSPTANEQTPHIVPTMGRLTTSLSGKVNVQPGMGLSQNSYTTEDKDKLETIQEGANFYEHPDTHSASMITESDEKQFVSETEKNTWNAKPESKRDLGLENVSNVKQMPIAGGDFTGAARAHSSTAYTTAQIRNVVFYPEGSVVPTQPNGTLICFYEG